MKETRPSLDPDQVLRQAAALAQHLQASGVDWVPATDDEEVAKLRSAFDSPSGESTSAEAAGNAASDSTSSTARDTARNTARDTAQSSAQPSLPTPAKRQATASTSSRDSVAKPNSSGPAVATEATSYPTASLDLENRTASLNVLAEQVSACVRCDALARCRTNTVFGEGNVSPRVVFFGEAPGRDEDLQGRPFVGKAGQLLTKMIQACSFAREEVYILNTVKCRPPNNRNPEPTEIENCREYFEQQLQILQPEYIVCLGAVSTQSLLNTKLSVGRLRGEFHRYYASKVVVTYHPAYLLRAPAAKKAAWADLQMMMRDAGLL